MDFTTHKTAGASLPSAKSADWDWDELIRKARQSMYPHQTKGSEVAIAAIERQKGMKYTLATDSALSFHPRKPTTNLESIVDQFPGVWDGSDKWRGMQSRPTEIITNMFSRKIGSRLGSFSRATPDHTPSSGASISTQPC